MPEEPEDWIDEPEDHDWDFPEDIAEFHRWQRDRKVAEQLERDRERLQYYD
ncbi:hypothetical protein [Chitinophaga sp. sic0106]|uniref:hypothetical protein n=1 Tax=Chitinophaga sp. sic0106 TaxID=2854785 RepID=UPI001C47CC5C|nr:hypothetical protein [Chitinophaga sp. sic0106]MBV7531322.1 hypothetical protein [Chitinophaga sp. sic0106]